ncbi:MAG: toll/interleukin-1 receptor domain-containing protein [Planctomycetota bacterium]|nr:toll/interleukin-1 receptor domain-containing protein [Planctomycetota bacterium]
MADAPQSIFISHATPADNEIARWLALRLMREGYSVWCDIERLRVGDDFWREIEGEIRTKAVKFILILSKSSYNRQGVLNELGVASKVAKHRGKRFILPIRADDISYDDFPIEANRLDAADFSKSWSIGMGRLMQILVEDNVPKVGGGPQEAADWWQKRYSATEGVSTEREEYSSNRFRITSAPKHVYLHSLDNLKPFEKSKFKPIYPVHQMGGLFVSFAPAEDLAKAFEDAEAKIGMTFLTKLTTFLQDGYAKPKIEKREARNVVTRLMRLAFQGKLLSAGLKPYELASKENYYWFPPEVVAPRKQVPFVRPNKTKGGRALVGAKILKDRAGTQLGTQGWHFGVEVLPTTWPCFGFHLRSHVAFTLNGIPYSDAAKQHRLRRRECKVWFNDRWADMLQAAVAQLANGANEVLLPVSTKESFALPLQPESFLSPVRFVWEKDKELPPYQPDEEQPAEAVDDDGDDDEEDLDE